MLRNNEPNCASEGALMQATPEGQRDHLFISYASEDIALAEWLTFKLTALGYKVWCDGIKLFGGESYPKDIDDAIKTRTYRLLAVMSEYSINKPNPRKERTIAHSISKERQINFIIPLNLGLKPTQLDWMTSDLTYVDFSVNWAEGLASLLKALRKAGTPCPLENGKDMISASVVSNEIVKDEPETIQSNFLTIKKIPEAVSVIRFEYNLNYQQRRELRDTWACRKISDRTFLAFDRPPGKLPYKVQDAHLWKKRDDIEGIDADNVVSELLRKSLECHCRAKGLVLSTDTKWLYFPFGITENNRV
ncbi:MAG: toll/interleukin-1 receptor domain-containing protein, partial [Phycisphaerae bacterium]